MGNHAMGSPCFIQNENDVILHDNTYNSINICYESLPCSKYGDIVRNYEADFLTDSDAYS